MFDKPTVPQFWLRFSTTKKRKTNPFLFFLFHFIIKLLLLHQFCSLFLAQSQILGYSRVRKSEK